MQAGGGDYEDSASCTLCQAFSLKKRGCNSKGRDNGGEWTSWRMVGVKSVNRAEEVWLLQLMTCSNRARRVGDVVVEKKNPPKGKRFARQSRKYGVLETGRDHREAAGQTGVPYLQLKGCGLAGGMRQYFGQGLGGPVGKVAASLILL